MCISVRGFLGNQGSPRAVAIRVDMKHPLRRFTMSPEPIAEKYEISRS